MTAAEWASVAQIPKQARRKVRAELASKVAASAEAVARELKRLEEAANRELDGLRNPLVELTELGYKDLSLPARLRVKELQGRARREPLKHELRLLRQARLAEVRQGKAVGP